jgi:hypothetical protein
LTSFVTHAGIFRYKRLNFDISCISEIFQHLIFNLIKDATSSFNISDDILIFGTSQEMHDQALHEVMKRLNEYNLTINKEKCKWFKKELDFFGLHFCGEGISLSESKMSDFTNSKTPTNKSDLHSFHGLGTYCSRFIPNYASCVKCLWDLTKKRAKFEWTNIYDTAFKNQKLYQKLLLISTKIW